MKYNVYIEYKPQLFEDIEANSIEEAEQFVLDNYAMGEIEINMVETTEAED